MNEKYSEIKNDYLNGMPLCKIADKYTISSAQLIQYFKKDGIFKPTNRRWTEQEISYLKNNYGTESWENILKNIPNRDKESIIHKAYKLKISRDCAAQWTQNDIEVLKDFYQNKTPISLISQKMHKSPTAIYTKANILGLRNRESWTDKEIQIIKDNYECKTANELLQLLPNRDIHTIRTYAHKFGLRSLSWHKKHNSKDCYRDIKHFIRSNNSNWKTRSMKHCNYKCIISNKRFEVIHHLISFDDILNQTIKEYKIEIKTNFQDYSNEELEYILNSFLKVQDKYPLGVCLTKEIHKQFHSEYGYGHNNIEQFNQFKERYNLLQNPVTTTAI